MREPTSLEPNNLEECVSRPHRPKCQVRASALRRYIGFFFVSDGKVGGLEKIGKGEKTDRINQVACGLALTAAMALSRKR